ncbi:MAG: peptidoglycan-binding protein [Candidatus Thiodiazotropha sp. (ex Lucinoma borealis)]|nr:peptidoglycan-binding protein [Candidatus Thiodiazotropha sp. (ex Lucinoma borealis)]
MSSKIFNLAFAHVTSPSIEGGFSDDPDDRGGRTNHGISQKSYPDLDIKNLSLERTRSIFLEDYWESPQCDKLPGNWGFALFDAVVNHGQKLAVIFMQHALRVKADGINGPITQAATRAADDTDIARFLAHRARFYFDITIADSTQVKFLNGWMNRLFLLQQAIHRHEGDFRAL